MKREGISTGHVILYAIIDNRLCYVVQYVYILFRLHSAGGTEKLNHYGTTAKPKNKQTFKYCFEKSGGGVILQQSRAKSTALYRTAIEV